MLQEGTRAEQHCQCLGAKRYHLKTPKEWLSEAERDAAKFRANGKSSHTPVKAGRMDTCAELRSRWLSAELLLMCSSKNRGTIILNFLQKDMRGSCVRAPSETSCHTLPPSGEPERTPSALLLPLPSGFLEVGKEMASQVEGLEKLSKA